MSTDILKQVNFMSPTMSAIGVADSYSREISPFLHTMVLFSYHFEAFFKFRV